MKKHNKDYYIKMVNRYLSEIRVTDGSNGKRFLLLKKKAQKALDMAKRLDAESRQSGERGSEAGGTEHLIS